jgi:hypothetical protein
MEVPVTGGWRYDEQGGRLPGNILSERMNTQLPLPEAADGQFTHFLNGEWDEESVLLFLLLEFIRQQ